MPTIPASFYSSVLSIGIKNIKEPDKIIWAGTAFIVRRRDGEDPKRGTFYIVTNKNVIGDNKKIYLRFNSLEGELVKDYCIDLVQDGEKLYSVHPDEKIDLAAFSFQPENLTEGKSVWAAIDLASESLKLEQMAKAGIFEGNLVHTIGYPINTVMAIRLPLVRLGCIARIQDAYFAKKQIPPFLIDAMTTPGFSGGPVIMRPEVSMIEELVADNNDPEKKQKKVTFKNTHPKLIGITSAFIPYGDAIMDPRTNTPALVTRNNTGFTVVIPVDRIIEVVDMEWGRNEISKSVAKRKPNLRLVEED